MISAVFEWVRLSASGARRAFAVVIPLVALLAACDRDDPQSAHKPPNRLIVFAAASVADVLEEIGRSFGAQASVEVSVSRGPSGRLCRQIELGAPCDVYVPADPSYLDLLVDVGRIQTDSRRQLAANRLVIVTHDTRGEAWTSPAPIASAEFRRIALANPEHAPAGQRAVEALQHAGLWEAVRSRVVYADDVRMAAQYVSSGAADAGIVYATDARALAADQGGRVYSFPEDGHEPIVYEGAVCASAAAPALARRFLEFAASENGRGAWQAAGFVVGSRTASEAAAP